MDKSSISVKTGYFEPTNLRGIVGAAQNDCFAGVRDCEEGLRLRGAHRSTLKRKALPRGGRKRSEIFWLSEAQVALGGDVEPNGIENRCGHVMAESGDAEFFVLCVNAARGHIFAFSVQQVAQVVEQRGGDKRVCGAFALDERRGLQRVFKHGDGFAKVGFAAAAFKQRKNFID